MMNLPIFYFDYLEGTLYLTFYVYFVRMSLTTGMTINF